MESIQRTLITTIGKLQKFGIQVPVQCVFCDSATETLERLFFDCTCTRHLWSRLLHWLGITRPIGSWHTKLQWINQWAKRWTGSGAIVSYVFAMLISTIWRERNYYRFQKGQLNCDKLCREISFYLQIRGNKLKK